MAETAEHRRRHDAEELSDVIGVPPEAGRRENLARQQEQKQRFAKRIDRHQRAVEDIQSISSSLL